MTEERRHDGDRRSAWQDERIDDLAKLVHENSKTLDATRNVVAAHDLQLIELDRARRAKSEHGFALQLAAASVFIGQLATIVTLILTHH